MKRLSAALLAPALLASSFGVMALAQEITPLDAGSVKVVDLPVSSAKRLAIDITDGRFQNESVSHMSLVGNTVDFRAGTMQSFSADLKNLTVKNVPVDTLNLVTSPLSFDTYQLLNNQRLIMRKPVSATMTLELSEGSLNKFLANPSTLKSIEKALSKSTGGMSLINFSNPNLTLSGKNKVRLNVMANLGGAVAVPLVMDGNLGVNGTGDVAFQNLSVSSGGGMFPPEVATVMQQKLNEQISFKRLSSDALKLHAKEIASGKNGVIIHGTADVTKLSFGD